MKRKTGLNLYGNWSCKLSDWFLYEMQHWAKVGQTAMATIKILLYTSNEGLP